MEKVILTELNNNRYQLLKPLEVTVQRKVTEWHPCKRDELFWNAKCPALKELEGHGKTKEEAVAMLEDMFVAFIKTFEENSVNTLLKGLSPLSCREIKTACDLYLSYAKSTSDVV